MKAIILLSILTYATSLFCQKGKYQEDLSSSRILYTDSIERVVVIKPDYHDSTDLDRSISSEEVVHLDVTTQIDSVINKIARYNKLQPPKVKGFRIQIYNGRSESAANKALTEAKSTVGEEIFSEVAWKAPVFRTRIGCFSNRLEAFRIVLELKQIFPNALIVPDYSLSADCIK